MKNNTLHVSDLLMDYLGYFLLFYYTQSYNQHFYKCPLSHFRVSPCKDIKYNL